jgi:hypothetical protein
MKWTVVYRSSAQDQLANIWLSAPNPQAVADAADEIDRILGRNPHNAGESRGDTTRVLVERPLAVLFEVFADDAIVEVFSVFYWQRQNE